MATVATTNPTSFSGYNFKRTLRHFEQGLNIPGSTPNLHNLTPLPVLKVEMIFPFLLRACSVPLRLSTVSNGVSSSVAASFFH